MKRIDIIAIAVAVMAIIFFTAQLIFGKYDAVIATIYMVSIAVAIRYIFTLTKRD